MSKFRLDAKHIYQIYYIGADNIAPILADNQQPEKNLFSMKLNNDDTIHRKPSTFHVMSTEKSLSWFQLISGMHIGFLLATNQIPSEYLTCNLDMLISENCTHSLNLLYSGFKANKVLFFYKIIHLSCESFSDFCPIQTFTLYLKHDELYHEIIKNVALILIGALRSLHYEKPLKHQSYFYFFGGLEVSKQFYFCISNPEKWFTFFSALKCSKFSTPGWTT